MTFDDRHQVVPLDGPREVLQGKAAPFRDLRRALLENGMLRARFGPGLIRKTVRLAEIASVRPIPVRWCVAKETSL